MDGSWLAEGAAAVGARLASAGGDLQDDAVQPAVEEVIVVEQTDSEEEDDVASIDNSLGLDELERRAGQDTAEQGLQEEGGDQEE